jgi:hypothetical protein
MLQAQNPTLAVNLDAGGGRKVEKFKGKNGKKNSEETMF